MSRVHHHDVPRALPPPEVQAVYDTFPAAGRDRCLQVRELLFEVADELGCGPVEETLRWGEPAYLTTVSRSGTTVRLAAKDPEARWVGVYVHCQTDLIDTFRARHPRAFTYEGQRALRVPVDGPLDDDALRDCLALALTYKRRAGRPRRSQ